LVKGDNPAEYFQQYLGQTILLILNTDKILITHLNLVDGSEVRVTVRAFNKAGLYGQVTSNPVVISLVPHLTVYDGTSGNDEDYQTSLNIIEGRWKYSDRCTIRSAEWSVQDIAGNILQDYLPLPRASSNFYSDILNLTNGRTYPSTFNYVQRCLIILIITTGTVINSKMGNQTNNNRIRGHLSIQSCFVKSMDSNPNFTPINQVKMSYQYFVGIRNW
jgi:hypothetical protein